MARWFLDSGLKFSRLVIAVAIAVLAIGITALRSASVDVYPEFRQPTVEVQAEALGLSAVEVEQLITVPLEQDLLNGVPWVERITSRSIPGLSSIELVFEEGTDLYRARQVVQERMTQAHALPGVGTPPVVVQPRSSLNRVAMMGLSSSTVSPIEMSVLARWQIKPRLLGVPGVANVSVWGQRDRQLQVQVDPARLHENKVTLTRLIETTGNAMWVSPLSFVEASTPGTGGFVETPNQRLGVQHVSPITSADELADVVIEGTSTPKRIGDVANVVEDHQPLIGDAAVNGEPNIMIVVDKFPEANTAQVSRDVAAAMAGMQQGLSGITVDTGVYRPASFVSEATSHIGLVALIGLLLMVVMIGLVLASWRVAVISLVTVPVSVTAALYVIHLRGATFSTMTVVGLAVALPLVVDDLVTDMDLVVRRLRDTAGNGEALPRGAVVVDALLTSRRPLFYATVIALLAAAPLLALTGLAGFFARPVVVTYALALLVSLLVALTLAPVLAVLLIRGGHAHRQAPMARWATRGFDRALAPSIVRRGRALAVVGVLALLALAVVPQLGSGLSLPTQQDRTLLVRLESAPGTALTEMSRVTGAVAEEVRSLPGVSQVGSHVGRAITSDQVVDVNSAELWVNIDSGADHDATTAAVRDVVTGYPGLRGQLTSYADDRIAAAGTEKAADLVVRVYGDDLATLQQTADGVRQMIGTVRGVVSPRVEAVPTQPTVRVEVDLDRARAYDLKPGDVRRETATLISGLLVGNLYEQQKVFDVVVWGGPAARQSPATLASLLIDTPDGGQVRLGDIADVQIAPEPVVVRHEAVRRYVDVLAAVPGGNVAGVSEQVTSRLRSMSMPLEFRAEVVSEPTTTLQVRPLLGWLAGAAVGVFLLFQAATRSWRAAGVLCVTIPLAGVGAVLVAPLVGGITTVGAFAGLVAVLVLAMRQGLVLLDRARTLAETTTGVSAQTTVLGAARERVAPVILSCLAVAALALPAAVTTFSGMEFLHPVAVTMLGGLVSTAIVTLFVLPALYLAFVAGRPKPGDLDGQPGSVERRDADLTAAAATSEGS